MEMPAGMAVLWKVLTVELVMAEGPVQLRTPMGAVRHLDSRDAEPRHRHAFHPAGAGQHGYFFPEASCEPARRARGHPPALRGFCKRAWPAP